MSPFSIDLEPLALGEFIEVEGWPGAVLSQATVRWKRATPSIVVSFSPEPNRSVHVSSITLEAGPDRSLTSADLRAFQFRQLTSALVSFLGTWGPDSLWATVSIRQISRADMEEARDRRKLPPAIERLGLSEEFEEMLTDPDQLAALRAAGPRAWAAVDLVNYLLDYAAENGLAPHTLVRDVLGLPKATASRWIVAAREQIQQAPE